jgi:hypothetical protein
MRPGEYAVMDTQDRQADSAEFTDELTRHR